MGKPYLIIFLVTVLLLNSFMAWLVATSSNVTTDQFALLAFKARITFDPDNILTKNWTTSSSFCNWIGVSCSHRRQRVTALNLSHMGIQGTIDPQIGNLSFLVVLDLQNNSFHSYLPGELGHLHRLKYLIMQFNQLEGKIPPSLSQYQQLQVLSLAGNKFSGGIPGELGNLPKLRLLFLDGNALTGTIPTSIGNLSMLQTLSLISNRLQGSIPEEIGNLQKLENIFLHRNKFTGIIPPSVGNISKLQTLVLGENIIQGKIPEEIGRLQNMQELYLYGNYLHGPIPQAIFNISTLRVISLSDNHLSGSIPPSAGLWLPNLEYIYLGGNRLNGNIPISIGNASGLIVLTLSYNNFTGMIPTTLGSLQFLRRLFLNGNQLRNQPDSPEITLLTSITNCRFLEELVIERNPINGILPASMGNLSSLTTFDGAESEIKGNIPRQIGNLSNLITFVVFSNDISGSIPSTMGGLKKLQRLYLPDNQIHGSIPNDLCHLSRLGELILQENNLSGPIPNCMGNLSKLHLLSLGSNMLRSQVPLSLSSLTDLSVLDLSHNSLYGYLPTELGNLGVLEIMDFSWNQLSHNIPSTISNLQRLRVLNLSWNSFQGSLPQSFGNLISMEYMELSSNNLSGEIPKSLEKLLYLNYLNLSFNRLYGEIPEGGPFANFTAQSFMGNDALCGLPKLHVPPCNIGAPKSGKKIRQLTLILPITVSVAIFFALLFVMVKWQMKRRNVSIPIDPSSLLAHRTISYQELLRATNNLCEENLLGVGSFSLVYKGTFSNGMIAAIKVFNLQLEGAIRSFDVECKVMRSIRHRNLVKVITTCSNLEFRALVLQFMPNGSLEKWLYSQNYYLDLLQRIDIMLDVALAMEYLHHNYAETVVHCDLKPSNILLNEDMVAHVGDFGITKILAANNPSAQTTTLGTIGYIAPEYGSGGRVSTSCDVYSYGIVLLETFTRKKPTEEKFVGELSLVQWVNALLPNTIMEVVDTTLFSGVNEEDFIVRQPCISSIIELALNCSRERPDERTNMKEVVVRLKKIKREFVANTSSYADSALLRGC